MKKLNLNPSTQKEHLELEERKWAIEKIIVSLTVILALFSWLFNVKAVALFFFVALIYELFFCAATFDLYNDEPTINKISNYFKNFLHTFNHLITSLRNYLHNYYCNYHNRKYA